MDEPDKGRLAAAPTGNGITRQEPIAVLSQGAREMYFEPQQPKEPSESKESTVLIDADAG